MDKITVIILTKNEEVNIVDVVENAMLLTKKVLVVDSGSIDKTVELAESSGAKVIYRQWDNNYSAQRNFALSYVTTKWVLYLDADERMNESLIHSIKKIVSEDKLVMCRFIRFNSAFGKNFQYGVLGQDSVIRLFPKNNIMWQGQVHENPVCNLPIITLDGYLKHCTYRSFDQYINKMNLYSSIGAKDNYNKNKKVNVFKDMVFRPAFAFFKMYILKKGFLEGWLGFVLCLNYANYTLNKYVKLKLIEEENRNS